LNPKTPSQPNEGEGNRTAAKRYDAAATQFAMDSDTEGIARDAALEMEQLVAQLEHFDVGMLVTARADGRLAARPMYVAGRLEDGTMRFVARRDASVVGEIREVPSVVVTFQEGSRYLSMTAHAKLLDPSAIPESAWREDFRHWFPNGLTSTDAVVLELIPESAEYWDETGIQSIRLFLRAAVDYLKGKPAGGPSGKHGTAALGSAAARLNAKRS